MSHHSTTTSGESFAIPAADDLGLVTLRRAGGELAIQLTHDGALFAIRHGKTLVNQLLPGPAEEGLFRLLLRWRTDAGGSGWAPLVGSGCECAVESGTSAVWRSVPFPGLECSVTLELHPRHDAWSWRVAVRNTGDRTCECEILLAQDLGLADEAAVRNNEAYTSQYIDLLPIEDAALGWMIFARQNQPASGGRHPWLGVACGDRAEAFCTDGWQFFGADHRLTGEPAAVRMRMLPSRRSQYDFALAGLQSRSRKLAPSTAAEFTFACRFVPDHAQASEPADTALMREALEGRAPAAGRGGFRHAGVAAASLFASAPWLHGEVPTAADWAAWFPGSRRQEEIGGDGTLLSFFSATDTHVVSREKEAGILRPHGQILRTGRWSWIDEEQFGVTCYAAGVFGAQAYLGNPSLVRLLPVVRNALGLTRGSGQRVFVRRKGVWRQLGIPSAFAMTPGESRWLYRFANDVIEARVWCARDLPASFLSLRVVEGEPAGFLVSHQVVLGPTEFEQRGELALHRDEAWFGCAPGPGLVADKLPRVRFAIAAAEAESVASAGGDELLFADGVRHRGGYAVLQSGPTSHFGVVLLGTSGGEEALVSAVAASRRAYRDPIPAEPAPLPVEFDDSCDGGVSRLAEVLPWFNRDAAIHFSAPHGLEQYGGGAWGVRDVCQGSVQWLLAHGAYPAVRRLLELVFRQQYEPEGVWPQWFMFPPFQAIQQTESHGDVCFWPIKALCDYAEASGDLLFLSEIVGYTDPKTFLETGPREPLWLHCDRVIHHVESRFVPGTSLVNYGDGDWDDTLQPADPKMRTHLISAWTVGLAYHTFRLFREVCRRAGEQERVSRLDALLGRMRQDFSRSLMPGGTVCGFLLTDPESGSRPLLHPEDRVTGIRYRLLPMTRAILAELFTPEEANRHRAIIEEALTYPDGVRLMSEPATYRGGLSRLFKRAETAANVGREIGLQYVHAHLRYAEAMAVVGDAERLWWALQVVNPVALSEILPNAAPRQANVYFSSSDADFADRLEAQARWQELRTGRVPVRGGWRLYSSGPGLFIHAVRFSLLGVRESFGDVVFDPVLPRSLDGLAVSIGLFGRPVRIRYRVTKGSCGPKSVSVDGAVLSATREPNPYRTGGLRVSGASLLPLLENSDPQIEILL
ncbi:hypothetical protein DB347_24065 [Opitutaceae bacterium EW11]|nr:hypothetical protein DB347_24065 [Opitutaceae bacterium EW11]